MIPMPPALLALALLVGADASGSVEPAPAQESGPRGFSVSQLPGEQRAHYRTFEQKCGRCHDTSRALEANFSAEAWRKYLKRKDRRSGANITDRQSEEIYQFLSWWSAQRTKR